MTQNQYPFLENSNPLGDKKQIFGVESQATIFNPPLTWEDDQFYFHLSLDKPKRPALAGR